ncbi:hypothetical protein ES703_42668 [subsurface metagenome]
MTWQSFVIGLGGILLGAFSTYLAFRSRISKHQELMYKRQLEGFGEVIVALTNFYIKIQNFLADKETPLTDEIRIQLRSVTLNENLEFYRIFQKWLIFLPANFANKLTHFVGVLNGISAHSQIVSQYPTSLTNASDPGGLIGGAYKKIIIQARIHLGTEALSQNTLKLIGKTHGTQINF